MSDKKLFQIGFNKTATTALFWLFIHSGHRALHSSGRRERRRGHEVINQQHPQLRIHHNILSGLPPVEGLEDFEAFFDMEYDLPWSDIKLENFKHFARFHAAYPNAKFILNIRNKDKWLRSRERHAGGTFLKNSKRRLHLSKQEVLDRWAGEFDRHNQAVRTYFTMQPQQLLVFDIERDPIEKLIAFCAPEFTLDPAHWHQARVTDTVAEALDWPTSA